PRRGQLTEQFAKGSERARVGHWVRTWRSSNRALIDHNCLVDLFYPANGPMGARFILGIMETSKQRASQNVVYQSGLAAAGNAGHTSETTERKRDGDVFQIVFRRPDQCEPAFGFVGRPRFGALLGNGNSRAAGKVIGSQRILRAQDIFEFTLRDNFAATRTRTGTKI